MRKRFLSALLALVMCLGLAIPAFAADVGALTTNFPYLTIYDLEQGEYDLEDTYADFTVLVVGRVTCGYTTGTLREVAAAFSTSNIANARIYLLDVDQPESTVRSYLQQKPSGTHIAWCNNRWTYNNLFWDIVHAVQPGVTTVLLPAVCVLDRDLQPIYYASHGTYDLPALTAALGATPTTPTTPTRPADPSAGVDANQPFAVMEQQAYQAMIALKEQYPEGMHWTNDNFYRWKGGVFSGGHGCAGFAFLLSDAAFGDLPARKVTNVTLSDVRVGDILRVNNDTHSVIVLEVHNDHVVIAEGNYNSSIHWGRTMSASAVAASDYLLTRYPKDAPAVPFADMKPNGFYVDAVKWAVAKNIANGTTAATFSPDQACTHAMILTFLWRAEGEPESGAQAPIALKGNEYYAGAVRWAAEKGMIGADFKPDAPCNRACAVFYIWQAKGKPAATSASPFTDVPANWASAPAVAWAVENGVTNGTGDGSFSPGKVCTRGEIVTFLHRAYVPAFRF